MSYVKNTEYVEMPFSSETAIDDFYTYSNLRDLAEKCEIVKEEEVIRCRTIGILRSVNGKFYLSELDTVAKDGLLVRLSVVYLKSPLPSTLIPYPVQVFGSMQWRNRPVIYAKLVQVLKTSIALRLNNTMDSITKMHIARNVSEEFKKDINQNDT